MADLKKYSHIVRFETSKNAPAHFDYWTFFWSFPRIDADASFEYFVLQPNGKVYYHWKLKDHATTLHPYREKCQSDFSKEFSGSDPKVFFHQKIIFIFVVDVGKIQFSEADIKSFEFGFTRKVSAIML